MPDLLSPSIARSPETRVAGQSSRRSAPLTVDANDAYAVSGRRGRQGKPVSQAFDKIMARLDDARSDSTPGPKAGDRRRRDSRRQDRRIHRTRRELLAKAHDRRDRSPTGRLGSAAAGRDDRRRREPVGRRRGLRPLPPGNPRRPNDRRPDQADQRPAGAARLPRCTAAASSTRRTLAPFQAYRRLLPPESPPASWAGTLPQPACPLPREAARGRYTVTGGMPAGS